MEEYPISLDAKASNPYQQSNFAFCPVIYDRPFIYGGHLQRKSCPLGFRFGLFSGVCFSFPYVS